jgi:deoxyribodipyrimidine photo-lyase
VIFEKDEVLTLAGKPYGVFTPYKNMWLKTLNDFYIKPYPAPVVNHATQHALTLAPYC